jgi:hypothetical protein
MSAPLALTFLRGPALVGLSFASCHAWISLQATAYDVTPLRLQVGYRQQLAQPNKMLPTRCRTSLKIRGHR